MIKMPKFDGLKKMSEGLAQSTKSKGIFDKIKSSVDSFGGADGMSDEEAGDDVHANIVRLSAELQEVSRIQANLLNNIKAELKKLDKAQAPGDESAVDDGPAGDDEAPKDEE
jgi:hypothetical protein